MTFNLLLQCGLYVIVLLALAKPLGEFMARVYQGERTFLHPVFGGVERATYRASGVDSAHEMRWVEYALAALLFNALGFLAVYALQRFQAVLRPSATSPMPYNGGASSGSNRGPLNPAHKDAVEERIKALREAGGDPAKAMPVDLVTASASGLDPHISPAAAQYQVARVAKVRGLTEPRVRELIAQHTEGRQLGVLGEPRVNVLKLNLALDRGSLR